MVKLNSEMKAVFEKQLAIVATASKDGIPNVGPKGSLFVIDDETLAYSESTGVKTFKNLQENPRIAVLVIDREKGDGYQVKGKAQLNSSGDLFERVARRQEERKRPRPKLVASITVEEVYSIKPGMTAKRLV